MEAKKDIIEITYEEINPRGLVKHEWYYFPIKELLFHKIGDDITRWDGLAAVSKFKQEFGYEKSSK